MILIVSLCREKLSELEFVSPIKDLVSGSEVIHYKELCIEKINSADKIILSGTALADFDYLGYDFSILAKANRPILGICAGFHALALAFGWELIDESRIGVYPVEFTDDNPFLQSTHNSYFLHSKSAAGDFEVIARVNDTPCMVRHKFKEAYGCIFHPEVLTKELIRSFVNRKE